MRKVHAFRFWLWLIALIGVIVPRRLRADWRQEWEGEIASAHEHPRLTRYALGSFADACWIRQRDIADLQTIDDLRHGFRQWRQQSGFVITAVGILGLSMAASVTAYSVVSQILMRPLPYSNPDGIVTLWERVPAEEERVYVAPGNFLDWRARATSFTQLAAAEPYSFEGYPDTWIATFEDPDGNYFQLVTPMVEAQG